MSPNSPATKTDLADALRRFERDLTARFAILVVAMVLVTIASIYFMLIR